MMRPMKLAGSQLMFGQGCLEHLKTIQGKRAVIVTGGGSMKKSGMLQKVQNYLSEAGIESIVFDGVEPDPSFQTVKRGADCMREYRPDWIVALGGGSPMDAAKAMWVYYEHEELNTLADILPPRQIPPLRKKAKLICIPSTSGTASEVSRSVVISDTETGLKHGVGNMEMMPDIAICDPEVTVSMPAHITAETGMDAMTHALEAYVSKRANYLSDILAEAAMKDIFEYLPKAVAEGSNLEYREHMINASMVAGLAFTNVSLGIVHSMAHTIGGLFHVSHGLADAVILPYVMRFNQADDTAKAKYAGFARSMGAKDLVTEVEKLNKKTGIGHRFAELIPDETGYMAKLDEMVATALADGCTKTNPVIPTEAQLKDLFKQVYYGK